MVSRMTEDVQRLGMQPSGMQEKIYRQGVQGR